MNEGYQIKQSSTAYALLFVMVDATDGYTPETGLAPTVRIGKAGGTSIVPTGAVSEVDSANLPGLYKVAGNATDSSTLGPLYLYATAAGARPAYVTFEVVAFDPQDAVRLGLSAIPNVTAGGTNGLLINGTNTGTVTLAALTVTGALTVSGGVAITQSTVDGDGVSIEGNGAGAGVSIAAGATGAGTVIAGGGTSGNAVTLNTTDGDALEANGPVDITDAITFTTATSSGTVTLAAMTVSGTTTHTGATVYTGNVSMAAGLTITQSTANGNGITVTGNGSGSGIRSVAGATGVGATIVGGSTSGRGLRITTTDGAALSLEPLAGNAITATGTTSFEDVTTSDLVTLHSLTVTNATTFTGNVGMAAGLTITQSTGNGHGIVVTGNGTGSGVRVVAGATGDAAAFVGGSTSGKAMTLTTTSGIGLHVAATGAIGAHFQSSSDSGMKILGNGGLTGGLSIDNNAGIALVIGDTGGAGSLRVSGATTLVGAVALSSTLGIAGTTSLAALTTSGTVTLNALTISSATTLTGAVSLGSTLSIAGTTTTGGISTGTISTGAVTHSALTVTNATALNGAVSLNSTLLIVGATTTLSSVTLSSLTVTNATTLSGAVSFGSTWGVTGTITATNASNNIKGVDVTRWLGTAVSAPTVAGVPNVNVKTWNDLATVALPLTPTTAGRTLDVSAGGEAGIDWANVGTPSSNVNLSNTTTNLVNTATTVTNLPNIGNGAYTVTATVTDGTDPLQAALVRVTSGVESFSNLTDASGEAQFSLNAGSFTVSITKGGYEFTPTTRTVTGNEAGTLPGNDLEMTATVIPVAPSNPAFCRIYGFVRSLKTGDVLKGVRVTATRVPGGMAYAGGFLVGNECSAVTSSTGLLELDVFQSDEIDPVTQWRIVCREAGIDSIQTLNGTTFDLSTIV